MSNRTQPKTDLIVALDVPKKAQALDLVSKLQGLPVIYKCGLGVFMAGGPELVRELVHSKNRVFLDLKFHDIPNTVAKAVTQTALLHVEMFTLHLAGGSAMVKAVVAALSDIPALKPKVLGVSVLTSLDDVHWAEVTRALTSHAVEASTSVAGLVEQGILWGVDGVVCSALELEEVRKQSPQLYTVVPGIRPTGASADDQARVMTPAEALPARAPWSWAGLSRRPRIRAKPPKTSSRNWARTDRA